MTTGTYRSRKATDKQIADDVGIDRELRCSADGCPNRWTVDAGHGRLCSAHAWADPNAWPLITQEQLDADAERAFRAQNAHQPAHGRAVTLAEKRAILHRLRALFSQRIDPRNWRAQLHARAARGERLGIAQRQALRDSQHASEDAA